MKKMVLASLMMVCLPWLAMAQSVDDDLYFIPKKKAEKKEEAKKEVKVVVPQKQNTTAVYAAPGSTVVLKDVKGNVRDVDEYNRRYTSRDNNFSMENDTLYIEEKPLNERGEWVNGFEGSQSDYEYAMRIVRFRNPRYAIPVSSPLYWDVVYSLPSWEWNVYDDGLYAYAFPTYTNRLWWDWRFNYPYGAGWGFSWGWTSPWHYHGWYAPGYWAGGYWGGYWGLHHHHHYSPYGWGGGYWGGGHTAWSRSYYDTRRAETSPHGNSFIGTSASRNSNRYSTGHVERSSYRTSRDGNGRVAGRVVNSNRVAGSASSVRPDRNAGSREGTVTDTHVSRGDRPRPSTTYTRPSRSNKGESTYTRPSSTRSSVHNDSGTTYQRGSALNRSSNYSRTDRSSNSNTYNSNRSSSRSSSISSGSSSRSSYSSSGSSGSSSTRSSGGGGGARRR